MNRKPVVLRRMRYLRDIMKATCNFWTTVWTLALALVTPAAVSGQILDPVTWDIALYPSASAEDGQFDLVFHAEVEPCWHIYSQFLESQDGPLPTWIDITLPEGVDSLGHARECTPLVDYDPNFMMDLQFFEEEVSWVQTLRIPNPSPTDTLRGFISFMVCDDSRCLPPEDIDFAIATSDVRQASDRPVYCPPSNHLCDHGEGLEAEHGGGAGASDDAPKQGETDPAEEGILGVFLLGMLLGFAALFTPCVFPMIPMTVSFFTKQSKTRAAGIRNALLYGFFIIFIYTGLGLLLTAVFGVDILNVISTDPFFNLFLFLLLIIFGASFLGAFEIQLPASWANKTDQAADRGGVAGIFFMAATLAIVSFSCTGPLVGSALAGAATGSFAAPAAVMFGFSLALAIPFALFSAFPGWLNSLPQSGGWLNSVKVVLGLVEIGFAFKFLSNADLVLQLGLLQRELFIAIWVAVSLAIAFYLFGWLMFPHDSKTERIGVLRFSIGMVALIFGIYLIPGMWGAPVNLISGFPPPTFYSEWTSGGHGGSGGGESSGGHVEAMYTDYEAGLAAAKEAGKPVLLDFTGWACVNCRKMEEQVWPDSRVRQILTQDVILISLYVDERTDLPDAEKRTETYGGKDFKIKTVGNKWSYMQAARFNTNSQPFYVMLDEDGEQIGGSAGYDPDPDVFVDFLRDGLEAFER